MRNARLLPYFDTTRAAMLISHAGDTASGAIAGTATAYRRAADLGFRAFQVDVVPTVGEELLSMHAVFGRRLTLERGDLATARQRAGEDVPTLRELLAAYPDLRWNIEVKSRRCESALVAAIDQHPRPELLCVSAPFHTRLLRRLRTRFPDLATNASLLEGALVGINFLPSRTTPADGVQLIGIMCFGPIIRWNVRRGRAVHAWTINDAPRAQELVAKGVTGIVTDDYAAVSDAVKLDS